MIDRPTFDKDKGKPVLIRFGEEETDVKETIRDHRHITNLKVGLMNLIPRP